MKQSQSSMEPQDPHVIVGLNFHWECSHGISNTIPCPYCYSIWRVVDTRPGSRDWETVWEQYLGENRT